MSNLLGNSDSISNQDSFNPISQPDIQSQQIEILSDFENQSNSNNPPRQKRKNSVRSGSIFPTNMNINSISVEKRQIKRVVDLVSALQIASGIINTGSYLTIFCCFIIVLIVVVPLLIAKYLKEWWLWLMLTIFFLCLCIPVCFQFYIGSLSFRRDVSNNYVCLSWTYICFCVFIILYSLCILLYKFIEMGIRIGYNYSYGFILFIYLIFLVCIIPCMIVSCIGIFCYKKYRVLCQKEKVEIDKQIKKTEEELTLAYNNLKIKKAQLHHGGVFLDLESPIQTQSIQKNVTERMFDGIKPYNFGDTGKHIKFSSDSIQNFVGTVKSDQTIEIEEELGMQYNPPPDFLPKQLENIDKKEIGINDSITKVDISEMTSEKENSESNIPQIEKPDFENISKIECNDVNYKSDISNHIKKM